MNYKNIKEWKTQTCLFQIDDEGNVILINDNGILVVPFRNMSFTSKTEIVQELTKLLGVPADDVVDDG